MSVCGSLIVVIVELKQSIFVSMINPLLVWVFSHNKKVSPDLLYNFSNTATYKKYKQHEWQLYHPYRYEIIEQTRCNITLVTKLQREDNNRRWRCQVSTSENVTAVFQDFTSIFLFQNPPTAPNLIPSAATNCPVELPTSRIVLCVALPIMVIVVGLFTWRTDRKHLAKTSAAGIELQQMNCWLCLFFKPHWILDMLQTCYRF